VTKKRVVNDAACPPGRVRERQKESAMATYRRGRLKPTRPIVIGAALLLCFLVAGNSAPICGSDRTNEARDRRAIARRASYSIVAGQLGSHNWAARGEHSQPIRVTRVQAKRKPPSTTKRRHWTKRTPTSSRHCDRRRAIERGRPMSAAGADLFHVDGALQTASQMCEARTRL
jgi:hypothetical protein